MWVGVVSIFPDMFRALTDEGVVARAIANGTLSLFRSKIRATTRKIATVRWTIDRTAAVPGW